MTKLKEKCEMHVSSFYHPRVTKDYLKTNHFRYTRGWSEDGADAYMLTVPLYRYNSLALLDLRIILYDDGLTRIDVLDSSTKGVYSPWYRQESYDRYPILKTIDNSIEKLMKTMGFQKRGNNERRKSNEGQYESGRGRAVSGHSKRPTQQKHFSHHAR
jgi:hypothetical protein